MPHAHIVAWSYEDYDVKDIKLELEGCFEANLSGIPVKVLRLNGGITGISKIASYIAKVPRWTKYNTLKTNENDEVQHRFLNKVTMESTERMRLVQLLSSLKMVSLMFADYEGSEIERNISQKLTLWHRKEIEKCRYGKVSSRMIPHNWWQDLWGQYWASVGIA